MKKFTLTAIAIFVCCFFSLAQKTKDEQDVLKLNKQIDEAIVKGDLSFYEKLLAPEYISYSPDGMMKNRTEVLTQMKKEATSPTFKLLSLKSEDVNINSSGNLAVVSARWKSEGKGLEKDAELHRDEGHYTAVFEKRSGSWVLISDHATEKHHTADELEPELKKASEQYDRALQGKDADALGRLLAEEFVSTNESGNTKNKTEDITQVTSSDLVFTSMKVTDKNFRIFRNSAVETGRFTAAGTFKGKPFSETGKYTSTWLYREGRWQMVADHVSILPATNAGSMTTNN